MKKIFITNGRLIDPKNKIDGSFNLLLEGGKVKQILKPDQIADADETIDAKGCIVSPGFIDLHTHLREPGFGYKETIETGTKAAAAGGFTSVCCMANTDPVNDSAAVTELILRKAREEGSVNVFPIGSITLGLMGQKLSPMGELKKAGCVGFSDDGKCVENNLIMKMAMDYSRSFDLPIMTHSVDPVLTGKGVMHAGMTSLRLGLPGIPNEAEDIMISRDIYLSKLTGARLHICHISTAEGVDLVRRAKSRGFNVTCEVTPHHFTLTDCAVGCYDTDAKMAPPLRGEKDREAVIVGMADGTIDAIATDHAPHAIVDKEVEFQEAACGVVGLETALSLSLSLVDKKAFDLNRMIAMLTVNPAQIVKLKKGSLEVGADADVVIFDPKISYKVNPAEFHSKSKNSPFTGMELKGKVTTTIVGGKVVYKI